MRTVALNEDGIFAQENALAQDMQDPYLNNNATHRADQQALAAIQSELIDRGALGDYSDLEQEVERAQWISDDSKAGLNQAVQTEKAAMKTLAAAQERFSQNMADVNAAKAVEDAIEGATEASFARMEAEKTFANSQRALEESLQQLDAARQKDMAKVLAQAEQYLAEMKRKRAEINNGQHEQVGDVLDVTPYQPVPDVVMKDESVEVETGSLMMFDEMDNESIIKIPWVTLKDGSIPNLQVRHWYVAQVMDIPNKINKNASFDEQVHQAFEWRNMIKQKARSLMADKEGKDWLDLSRPIKSFDELLISKMERKGMTHDEALQDIYDTAAKTNDEINRQFGVGR